MNNTSEILKTAIEKTLVYEGGYSFDSVDPGGETFMGISRVYWPSWEGWEYIHDAEDKDNLETKELVRMVYAFYHEHFWNQFCGDIISSVSEEISIELFDTSVNLGVHKAVKFLQESLNVLNINSALFPDMDVDGKFGERTMECFSRYFDYGNMPKERKTKLLLNVMNVFQGNYYISKMRESPGKEKYRGWFFRV